MKAIKVTRPNEQRNVEQLLSKLAKIQPIGTKPAPISKGIIVLKSA